MSMKMLRRLNGDSHGRFRDLLDRYDQDARAPRIAWYPSAGRDFRALMFLSQTYQSIMRDVTKGQVASPEIFLFTDYHPWKRSSFLDSRIIHDDGRTRVQVEHLEELPRLELPLDSDIVSFPKGSGATNRVVYLEVEVWSSVLGFIKYPVLYAFCENEAFCAERILADDGQLSYVIHVRYGGGLGGGGKSAGGWLPNILNKVNCEVFVTDGRHDRFQSGDQAAVDRYPVLRGTPPKFDSYWWVPSSQWSGYGDVNWNRVLV